LPFSSSPSLNANLSFVPFKSAVAIVPHLLSPSI
jgi:hypothetical protein